MKKLLREVGKPRNAHTIDIDGLATLKGWLTEDEATRAQLVGELAAELDAIRLSPDYQEFKSSAWQISARFQEMISIARTLDRLLRPRLPLTEIDFLHLVRFSTDRRDYSPLRLTAQLEHYGKTTPISSELRAALLELASRYTWDKKLTARLAWLTSENQPERAAAEAAKPSKKKAR